MFKKTLLIFFLISLSIFVTFSGVSAEITHYTYRIVDTYPHDKEAFTQGFLYHNGSFFEGTGLKGKSSLRKTDLDTGDIIDIVELPEKYFGEGITIFNNKIYQLTWKAETGFIYNMDFELIKKFKYSGEGWGLTHNENQLIMSNGSSTLYFLNPENLEIEKELNVKRNGESVSNINELEYIRGEIYANIWHKNYILRINPDSGKVTGIIDLEDIISPDDYNHKLDVLNGIAYDKKNDRLFVTGKLWPLIFEIELVPEK